MPRTVDLSKPSRLERLASRRGIGRAPRVDREGGDKEAGIIRRYAVITEGEALGHGQWVDAEFVAQVGEAMREAGNKGIKSRFTHPGLSGDGLGSFLGRTKSPTQAEVDGHAVAFADLHFSPTAHETPDGNLASYAMDLANDDPEAFGSSIVFGHDYASEKEFAIDHGAVEKMGEFGPYLDMSTFKSPDPRNTKNLMHVRLAELRAVDIVDSPAANPNGLFHRGDEIAADADAVMSYALGLTDEAPDVSSFGIDPDRLRGFASRFLDQHNLTVTTQEQTTMSTENKDGETPATTDKPDDAPEATETDTNTDLAEGEEAATEGEAATESPAVETPPATPETQHAEAPKVAPGKQFLDEFGDIGGKWFAEGKTIDEARAAYTAKLKADNAALQQQVDAGKASRGESEPAEFNSAKSETAQPSVLSPGAAAYAAGIKLPK